eukprot:6905059-Alexandrium_andersonii.AAC.1
MQNEGVDIADEGSADLPNTENSSQKTGDEDAEQQNQAGEMEEAGWGTLPKASYDYDALQGQGNFERQDE